MRGRKPKPAELREIEGNPGKRPLPEPVRVQGRAALTRPRGMSKFARECWDFAVPALQDVGVVDGIDRMALEGMCSAYERAKTAREIVGEQGPMTTGSTGQLVAHPMIAVERESWALFLRYVEQFGLTPVARVRLGLAELQRRTIAEEMRDRIGTSPRLAHTGG